MCRNTDQIYWKTYECNETNPNFDLIDKTIDLLDQKFDLLDRKLDLIDRIFDLIDKNKLT